MQGFQCPYCDAAVTRTAVLALQLRKTAAWAHRELQHTSAYVDDCAQEPCVSIRTSLRTAGLPTKRD